MHIRPLTAALTILLVVSLSAQASATTRGEAAAGAITSDPGGLADLELVDGLYRIGMLDTWLDGGSAGGVDLLRVPDDEAHAEARTEVLDRVESIREIAAISATRTEGLNRLDSRLAELRAVLAETRAGLFGGVGVDVHVAGASDVTGLDGDLVAIAGRIDEADDEIATLLAQAARVHERQRKSPTAVMSLIGQMDDQLFDIERTLSLARRADVDRELEILQIKAEIVEFLEAMHTRRPLTRSEVNGLSFVVLDAYVSGADLNADRCAIDWTLLAGIGRIESRHGTLDGATVRANGDLTHAIFGPLLDGGATEREAEAEAAAAAAEAEAAAQPTPTPTPDPDLWGAPPVEQVDTYPTGEYEAPEPEPRDGYEAVLFELEADDDEEPEEEPEEEEPPLEELGNGFAVIEDTDGGALDGNSRWDRAIGPMQFLPGTWERWKIDGNGDGVADPQNMYDAAASAGNYLCYLEDRLGGSVRRYLLGYNQSSRYVSDVLDVAGSFAWYRLPELDATD